MSHFEIVIAQNAITKKKIGFKNIFVLGRSLRLRACFGKTEEMEGQFAMHSVYYKILVLIICENGFQG